MANHTTKLGTLTDSEALAVIPEATRANGGGWFKANGREWYACVGAHKCGHNGWKILECR